jgi:hypothetical protein
LAPHTLITLTGARQPAGGTGMFPAGGPSSGPGPGLSPAGSPSRGQDPASSPAPSASASPSPSGGKAAGKAMGTGTAGPVGDAAVAVLQRLVFGRARFMPWNAAPADLRAWAQPPRPVDSGTVILTTASQLRTGHVGSLHARPQDFRILTGYQPITGVSPKPCHQKDFAGPLAVG